MKKILYLGYIVFFGFLLISCDTTSATTIPSNTTTEISTTFTLEQLSQYTGANGSTAYVAVNGIIYDVTNVFDNGKHEGLQLGGTDATAAFSSSSHTTALLDTLTVVGTLDTSAVITTTQSTTTVSITTEEITTTNIEVTTTIQITLRVFTLSDLANYSGTEDTTAYMAVDGVVYDVTNEFSSGRHEGMQLGGTDASELFSTSPHAPSILNGLTIVGSLEGYDVIVVGSDGTTTP